MIGFDRVPNIYNSETVEIFKLVGIILAILKLSVVLVVIGIGTFDFYKAVISKNDDELKKSSKRFALRLVAAALIFFLPSLVTYTISSIGAGRTVWVE